MESHRENSKRSGPNDWRVFGGINGPEAGAIRVVGRLRCVRVSNNKGQGRGYDIPDDLHPLFLSRQHLVCQEWL